MERDCYLIYFDNKIEMMPLKTDYFAIILLSLCMPSLCRQSEQVKKMKKKVSNVKKGPSWYITHIILLPATTLFDSVVAGNRSYTSKMVSKI
jgi:hypothetical protein